MRTPLTYYGGKQQLTPTILRQVPPHKVYAEPFTGGAAIFFAKEPSPCEILNDTNGELINFYEVCKRDFSALQQKIEIPLHCRTMHEDAEVIYASPRLFTPVQRAWAVWMLASSSYGSKLNGSFAYDRVGTTSKNLANKRKAFTIDYSIRLQNVQIECCDALRIIQSRDTPETFFYCNPPYVGSYQGHYDGYAQEDFDKLLETLASIKGKFLLSSYRNTTLSEYRTRHNWFQRELKMNCSMTNHKNPSAKIEVLTANYPLQD